MFKLPPLPYAYDALQPTLSADTMHEHHDKHHAKYVDTLNELLEAEGRASEPLESIIAAAANEPRRNKLFNNAAQAWNHTFFWNCMAPQGQAPQAALMTAIERDFGSMGLLKAKFVAEGASHFASGWVWLAARGPRLEVLSTHDAANLVTEPGLTPLVVCDVWEHAYYLDHQSDRKAFLEGWFDRLPNWAFAAGQLRAASGEGEAWTHPAPVQAQEQARVQGVR